MSTLLLAACGSPNTTPTPAVATVIPTPETNVLNPQVPLAPPPTEVIFEYPIVLTPTPLPANYPAPTETPDAYAVTEPETEEVPAIGLNLTDAFAIDGLIYENQEGVWTVENGVPIQRLTQFGKLSPDREIALYYEQETAQLVFENLETGEKNGGYDFSGEQGPALFAWSAANPDIVPVMMRTVSPGELFVFGRDGQLLHQTGVPLVGDPAISPDGTAIAYGSENTIKIYTIGGDTETITPTLADGRTVTRIGSADYAPDGNHITWTAAISDDEVAVLIHDLTDNSFEIIETFEFFGGLGWFYPAKFSPDGTWLAFHVPLTNNDVPIQLVLHHRDSKDRRVFEFGSEPNWNPAGTHLIYRARNIHRLYNVASDSYQEIPLDINNVQGWLGE